MPNAPTFVTWLPKIYGYYPVYRGTGSRGALKAAAAILKQGGLLGIFPEAGSWAQVLRPARPGTAYLAAQTGVRILPVRGSSTAMPDEPGVKCTLSPERSCVSLPRTS